MDEADKRKKLQGLLAGSESRTLFVGTATPVDVEKRWPPPVDALIEHVEFMKGLEADGRLFASGPMLDEDGERVAEGLVILDVPDLAAAEALMAEDPFAINGYRKVELRGWHFNSTKQS